MLPQFSVRKPYTVLVAVVLVLVLGVISFTGMTTDLLPAMELPYVVVMTTYPGASPEKIETTVTKPLEAVLGTTGGIKNVSSVSSENASIVILEFEQGTNMDSAMIELSSNVDLVSGQMDDAVGTPMLMKISPDMLPVMVASVDMDGMDVKEISAFADETVMPAFERIDGVASVDATGLVEQQVTVTLDQAKIDALTIRSLPAWIPVWRTHSVSCVRDRPRWRTARRSWPRAKPRWKAKKALRWTSWPRAAPRWTAPPPRFPRC